MHEIPNIPVLNQSRTTGYVLKKPFEVIWSDHPSQSGATQNAIREFLTLIVYVGNSEFKKRTNTRNRANAILPN